MYKNILRTTKVAVEKVTSLGLIALMAMLSFMVMPSGASAADLNAESVTQSNPTISQTGNVFTLSLGSVSASLIRCINIDFTTAVGGTTLPTGMGITPGLITPSGSIGSIGGWTETNPNTYTYRITDGTGITPTAGTNTIILTGVTNGSVKNTTYFTEVNTFSDAACTTAVDTDGIATFVFTEGVVVSATVNPSLTFTVDSTTCNLGVLSASTTGSCSHTMTAASNATSGYTISYISSATLTSGANTITANGATAVANAVGGEQFGLNLRANTTPTVGADKSGDTAPTVAANYNTVNSFAFAPSTATTIATSAAPTSLTTFTVSYIANISSATEAGLYTKTQTYNITATY